jgi:hypothetical protein
MVGIIKRREWDLNPEAMAADSVMYATNQSAIFIV